MTSYNICTDNNICPGIDITIDQAFIDDTGISSNIYGLNSSNAIAKKKFETLIKCADLKRMTNAQKYSFQAKGYLFNMKN